LSNPSINNAMLAAIGHNPFYIYFDKKFSSYNEFWHDGKLS
jgi:hypothetical protein